MADSRIFRGALCSIFLLVGLVLAGGSSGLAGLAGTERGGRGPNAKPFAVLGGPARNYVTRVNPLTLAATGPQAHLGEYHSGYSFSPNRSAIAFGISAPPSARRGARIGIRVVEARDLEVSANLSTGVYASAVAWLEPRRVVALLRFDFRGDFTIASLDPVTGEEIARRQLDLQSTDRHCDSAEARERALVVLVGRTLFIVDADATVRTAHLPPEFSRCGEVALAPGADRALVASRDGDSVAEVALADASVSLSRFPGGPGGDIEAAALGPERLVLAHRGRRGKPKGVELLDIGRGARETIDPAAARARVSGGTILTYGQGRSRADPIGVRGYRRDGERSFSLLDGRRVTRVEPAGRFAYAIEHRGVSVVDVRSGDVVSRSGRRFNGDLLELQGGSEIRRASPRPAAPRPARP